MVSMVADMGWGEEDRQQESSTRAGLLPQQMAFFLNNILMFGINTTSSPIDNLHPQHSFHIRSGKGLLEHLGIFSASLGRVDMSFIPTDITWTFTVIL